MYITSGIDRSLSTKLSAQIYNRKIQGSVWVRRKEFQEQFIYSIVWLVLMCASPGRDLKMRLNRLYKDGGKKVLRSFYSFWRVKYTWMVGLLIPENKRVPMSFIY